MRRLLIVLALVLLSAVAGKALAQARNDLVKLYQTFIQLSSEGKYAEAAIIGERILKLTEAERGPNVPATVAALNNLANVYANLGRYAEAIQSDTRALAIVEKALGPDSPYLPQTLNNLANVYMVQGMYAEAAAISERMLKLVEAARGPNDSATADVLNNLANVYGNQGKYNEAVAAATRALTIHEKTHGPDHPDVAGDLINLGIVYRDQGKYDEAVAVYTRALAIREKALGPDHLDTAQTLNNLGIVYDDQGKYDEAVAAYTRALAIKEKALGPDHSQVATTLNNLANVHDNQGKYSEAVTAYNRALAIREKVLGPNHPDVASTLNNLGVAYRDQGKYAEAIQVYSRALAILEKALGRGHPNVATALNNIAMLYAVQRDWAKAVDYGQRATAILEHRTSLGAHALGQQLVWQGKSEATRNSDYFQWLIKAAWHNAVDRHAAHAETALAMFLKAQWVLSSEAAAAVSQMSARGVKGNSKLAARVRERQDLIEEWQQRDQARTAAVSQPAGRRNHDAEAANVDRLNAIEARIGEIDKQLTVEFPDYSALASPTPASVEDVQKDLAPDEALILTLDTGAGLKPLPEETFIWVVTKTQVRWAKSEFGTDALRREVAALRCGLDFIGSWLIEDSPCPALTNITYTSDDYNVGKPLPFDLARAHTLYQGLFSQVADLVRDKSLLVVPSGALTQLPFEVLVTKAPDPSLLGAAAMRQAKWLIRDHAITVLPSVTSLKALRELAKPSQATRPMIGFGNPLLDGCDPERFVCSPGAQSDKLRAERARLNTTCPVEGASLSLGARGLAPLSTRGGQADVAEIRAASPLPETADELCAVANKLHVNASDIYLGSRATVAEVEKLSEAGTLATYRLLHFATHGLLSGQISGNSEPGLILTPPVAASAADDGYLSASRIAGLKLDADWVVLSACNTAAGGASDADALSGLARAFFYAGARALLVSHWSVNSLATVKLITGAADLMAADKTIGRAEALRQSELSLIEKYDPNPATWAPFVVVGEGAAAK